MKVQRSTVETVTVSEQEILDLVRKALSAAIGGDDFQARFELDGRVFPGTLTIRATRSIQEGESIEVGLLLRRSVARPNIQIVRDANPPFECRSREQSGCSP